MNIYTGDSSFDCGEKCCYEFGVHYIMVIVVVKKNSFALTVQKNFANLQTHRNIYTLSAYGFRQCEIQVINIKSNKKRNLRNTGY